MKIKLLLIPAITIGFFYIMANWDSQTAHNKESVLLIANIEALTKLEPGNTSNPPEKLTCYSSGCDIRLDYRYLEVV